MFYYFPLDFHFGFILYPNGSTTTQEPHNTLLSMPYPHCLWTPIAFWLFFFSVAVCENPSSPDNLGSGFPV